MDYEDFMRWLEEAIKAYGGDTPLAAALKGMGPRKED